MTSNPEYRHIDVMTFKKLVVSPVFVDINRFLGETMGSDADIQYYTVGKSS
jgi:hypothetical protein